MKLYPNFCTQAALHAKRTMNWLWPITLKRRQLQNKVREVERIKLAPGRLIQTKVSYTN